MPSRFSRAAFHCGASTARARSRSFGITSRTISRSAAATNKSATTRISPLSDGAVKSEAVKMSPITTRTTCTMPPASEFMMPELAATATLSPRRSKKRITSAVFARVPPIRPVKLFANCSASTGLNGSGAATEPMRATEPENGGPNEMMNATATHAHSAFSKVVAQSIPANSPMMR